MLIKDENEMMLTPSEYLEKKWIGINTEAIAIILTLFFLGVHLFIPLILLLFFNLSDSLINIISQSIFTIIVVVMVKDYLIDSWKVFLQNKFKILKRVIFYYVMIFTSNFVITMLITLLGYEASSENQDLIISLSKQAPGLIMLLTIFLAPVNEELVFRTAMFRNWRSSRGFLFSALVSSFLFGFIHIMGALIQGHFGELLILPVYVSMGYFCARIYEETGTVYAPIFLHMLNNAISILSILYL